MIAVLVGLIKGGGLHLGLAEVRGLLIYILMLSLLALRHLKVTLYNIQKSSQPLFLWLQGHARAHTQYMIPEDSSKPYILYSVTNNTETKSTTHTKLVTTYLTSNLANLEIAPQ